MYKVTALFILKKLLYEIYAFWMTFFEGENYKGQGFRKWRKKARNGGFNITSGDKEEEGRENDSIEEIKNGVVKEQGNLIKGGV